MLGEPITCLGLFLLFIFAFPGACFLLLFCAFFLLLKKIQKDKICLVSCFSFFFCLMHLDSSLNSHVVFVFVMFIFLLLKNFKKTICLVSCFSFFFCLMHLDSSLNSHVSFMDLIPCVLECS